MNVPELRFPEFSGEWKEKKLGEISKDGMYGMNTAATDFDSENKYIRITDIDENSHKFRPNPLCSPEGYLDDKFLLKENDLLFARTGASTGKSYLYEKADGKLYFAGFLIKFHINNANPKFIFYNTIREKYYNWVKMMSVRSGQPGINAEEYKKFEIKLPSFPEQEKIASFLSKIDEKIEKLGKKEDLWQNYKKGMMQQLFSQKLRFKYENGDDFSDWEEKKISEIGKIVTGTTPSTKDKDNYENGKYLWVTPTDITSFKYIKQTERKLTDKGIKKGREIPGNSILVTCIASIGKNCIVKEKCSCNQQINAIIPKKEFNNEFIYYLIEENSDKLKKYAGITATPILNKNSFEKLSFKFPIFLEQAKIANLLSSIDKKIEQINKELEINREFKKGLLQKMFPKDQKSTAKESTQHSILPNKPAEPSVLL
ncbi:MULTISPECIES: restriction endonuclease subunit S [Methanobacterium]|uniref:Restriction endonuclease subunit S n=1 Tax=Methanobacterium veterum TaxID=408577 RepID=A0A9E5A192_9EURY|nr:MULTISPECIES: restriction endonuclease subunit S [Methanobacterium]MCZ3367268.1 restriction endonuclease subunit S [Methanobacterium veterum]MCZ3373584.1 restriction endonuclease subunit S [Methanobacterium veterum]